MPYRNKATRGVAADVCGPLADAVLSEVSRLVSVGVRVRGSHVRCIVHRITGGVMPSGWSVASRAVDWTAIARHLTGEEQD